MDWDKFRRPSFPLPSPNMKFFLEVTDAASSGLKRRGIIQLVHSSEASIHDVVHMAWITCTSVKAPLMLNNISKLLRQYTFFSVKALLINTNHSTHISPHHPLLKSFDALWSRNVSKEAANYRAAFFSDLRQSICAVSKQCLENRWCNTVANVSLSQLKGVADNQIKTVFFFAFIINIFIKFLLYIRCFFFN